MFFREDFTTAFCTKHNMWEETKFQNILELSVLIIGSLQFITLVDTQYDSVLRCKK